MSMLSAIKQAEAPLDIDSIFADMRNEYGLRHIVYHATNVRGLTGRGPYLKLTYDKSWTDRYFEKDYFGTDPVLEAGVSNFIPFNWDELDWTSSKRRRFRCEAFEFGVGSTGLSVPIRGLAGEHAILSVTSDMPAEEWAKYLREHMSDFQVIAHHLHEAIVEMEGAPRSEEIKKLSGREREVLQLYAHGLRVAEVSDRLKISERTVRGYLESARGKLRAINSVHAVTKAIGRNIILPPY